MCNKPLRLSLLIATAACLLLHRPLLSQEQRRHAAIEKYLDSQTLGVAWIDISQIDVDKLADFGDSLAGAAPVPQSLRQDERGKMKAVQQALRQNQVTYVYWIAEFAAVAQGPESVVIPTPNPAEVAGLLNSFVGSNTKESRFVQDGNAVVGGKRALVDALLKTEGKVAPALTEALAGNQGPHGLVALTPVPLTSALLLSPAVQRWSGNDLAAASALGESLLSLKSVSIETELPPTRARLRIETQSAEAAKKAADFGNEALKTRLPEAAEQLTWAAEGVNILLESDSLERSAAIYHTLSKLFGHPGMRTHMQHMQQIALALHNYMDAHGRMPPQALTDKSGKRLLSWRVLILPYLEEMELYQKFKLDEPWDSEHNLKLAQSIPSIYDDVAPQVTPPRTRIVAPLTPDSPFGRPGTPIYFSDVTDGTSNTIWLVQADQSRAVVWTKPEDIVIDPQDAPAALLDAQQPSENILVGRMDGSVQALSVEGLKKWLVSMLTIQGGEATPSDLK